MIIFEHIREKNIILEKLKSDEFIELINKFNIVNVIIFGSILTDEFYEGSDVSMLMRNRFSHRYKEPKHQEIFSHITKYKDKFDIMVLVAKSYLE